MKDKKGDPQKKGIVRPPSLSPSLKLRRSKKATAGKDHVKIYNDAYSVVISTKHPNALGAKGKVVWPEIWHIIGPMQKDR